MALPALHPPVGDGNTHTCCTCSRRVAGWPGSPRLRSAAGSSAPALCCSPAPPGRGGKGGGTYRLGLRALKGHVGVIYRTALAPLLVGVVWKAEEGPQAWKDFPLSTSDTVLCDPAWLSLQHLSMLAEPQAIVPAPEDAPNAIHHAPYLAEEMREYRIW